MKPLYNWHHRDQKKCPLYRGVRYNKEVFSCINQTRGCPIDPIAYELWSLVIIKNPTGINITIPDSSCSALVIPASINSSARSSKWLHPIFLVQFKALFTETRPRRLTVKVGYFAWNRLQKDRLSLKYCKTKNVYMRYYLQKELEKMEIYYAHILQCQYNINFVLWKLVLL